jgi:hypothetical protein
MTTSLVIDPGEGTKRALAGTPTITTGLALAAGSQSVPPLDLLDE